MACKHRGLFRVPVLFRQTLHNLSANPFRYGGLVAIPCSPVRIIRDPGGMNFTTCSYFQTSRATFRVTLDTYWNGNDNKELRWLSWFVYLWSDVQW
jgi:hypothetical protein